MLTKKPGSILQTIVFQISLGQVLLTHEPEASTCCCIIVIWQNVISYQYYCCYVIIIAVIIIIIIIILLILFDFFFFSLTQTGTWTQRYFELYGICYPAWHVFKWVLWGNMNNMKMISRNVGSSLSFIYPNICLGS